MLTNQRTRYNICFVNRTGKDDYLIKRFEDFVSTIASIHKNIQKIKKHKMKEFGLGGNHVMCLFYLAKNPNGLTGGQLAQQMKVDKAAASRALAELLEKGYVYYPDTEEQKKYRAIARLTIKGFAVTEQIDDIICDVVNQIGSGLSVEDRENMYRSLGVIEESMKLITKDF